MPEPTDVEEVRCSQCDEVLDDEGSASNFDGELYCEGCADEQLTSCYSCSETMHRDGDYCFHAFDAVYCETCFYDRYISCSNCSETESRDEAMTHAYETYCASCGRDLLTSCDRCGDYMLRDDGLDLDAECDRLGEDDIEAADEYRDSCDFECICEPCGQHLGWLIAGCAPYRGAVKDYYFKPAIVVRRGHKSKLLAGPSTSALRRIQLYGLELEVEFPTKDEASRNEIAKDINVMGGELLYCKHDSSIRNGFEVVSHPGTLNYWLKEDGRQIWDEVLAFVDAKGGSATLGGRCGYHIHANKLVFSRLHLFNMARFAFYPRNRMFFYGMSRRNEQQLSSYAQISLPERDEPDTETHKRFCLKLGNEMHAGSRGQFLNFGNAHTIELRLLRGTLDRDTFWAGLEFFNSLIQYTDPKKGGLGLRDEPRWAAYREYVNTYPLPHEVAELRTHLEELGI